MVEEALIGKRGWNVLRSRRRRTTPPAKEEETLWLRPPPRRTRHRTIPWSRRALVMFVVLVYFLLKKYKPYSGRRMDHYLIYWTLRLGRRHDAFIPSDPRIPPTEPTQFPALLHTHLWLRTMLRQRHDRTALLQRLAQQSCDEDDYATTTTVLHVPQVFIDREHRWDDVSKWVRPTWNYTTIVRWEVEEMEQLVRTVLADWPWLAELLDPVYEPGGPRSVDLFALCVVYTYGGIFFNGQYHNPWLYGISALFDFLDGSFSEEALVVLRSEGPEILFVGAWRPRDPLLLCMLLLHHHEPPHFRNHSATTHWQRWPDDPRRRRCASPEKEHLRDLCRDRWTQPGAALVDGYLPWNDFVKPSGRARTKPPETDGSSQLYIQWILDSEGDLAGSVRDATYRWVAEIKETPAADAMVARPRRQPKVSLQSRMPRGIEPNWFCNRCLHWSERGTYPSCALVCAQQYMEFMCRPDHPRLLTKEHRNVTVEVVLQPDTPWSTLPAPTSMFVGIPRIIHQTWYEDITLDRYPQLARIQASWKTYAGWEYRFYNDAAAREYIQMHYPSRFLDAYDSLIHGAYKADLFRYLVLLREGGVYADIDVMLQGSLDSLITSSLSFFVPRDIPCAYADEAYCLWNGLIGSTPGNPILVRTVERLINFIEHRADLYDMERDLCVSSSSSANGTFPVWKLRAEPLLVLSGPCGFGMAMNEALQRSPLTSIPLGYLRIPDNGPFYAGDALVLLGDKFDLGAFRISHPETGVIIAATDILSDSDKVPLEEMHPPKDASLRHRIITPQHYSKSKSDNVIWGSANVYTDNLVRFERIRITVNWILNY